MWEARAMPASSLFSAEVRPSADGVLVLLRGDMNAAAEPGLAAAYAAAVAGDAHSIALDFSDADYINSTGIALIVRLLADARRDHRDVAARGPSPHYAEIFRITRLSDYMRIEDAAGAPAGAGAASEGGAR